MFKIALIDIGGDGEFCSFTTDFETLAEVEILARNAIIDHLNTLDVELIYDDELVYEAYAGGRSAGFVAIQSL